MPLELSETTPGKMTARSLREVDLISDQFSSDTLKVVPSDKWGVHYPSGKEARTTQLEALLKGTVDRAEVAQVLRPDRILFDAREVQDGNLSQVQGRLRDITSRVEHYDYEKLLDVVESMQGKDVSLDQVLGFYDSVVQSQTRQKILDSFGETGQEQLKSAMEREVRSKVSGRIGSIGKVFEQLKQEWMADQLGQAKPKRDSLSDQERALAEQLAPTFDEFISQGSSESYQQLLEIAGKNISDIELPQGSSEAEADLREEVEEFMPEEDENVDMTIPPDESDTYEVPPLDPDSEDSSPEKQKKTVVFEIEPSGTSTKVKIGKYSGAHKSYFNPESLEWSTKKQLRPYTQSVEGTERQTIRGRLAPKLFALNIPVRHQLDMSSFTYSGTPPNVFQDQNGDYYIQGTDDGLFSIDFLSGGTHHLQSPNPADTTLIHTGSLSEKTEALLSGISGTNSEKSIQIQEHIWKHHVYPGDGDDLRLAGAVQAKLKATSAGNTYIKNIDAAEAIECYSAANLGVALCRSAGVPARLCTGHDIDSAKDGKALITPETGHGWGEIWTGSEWIEIDFTPVKSQTKSDPSKTEKKDETETEKANEELLGEPPEDAQEEGDPSEPQKDDSSFSGAEETGSDGPPSEGMNEMGDLEEVDDTAVDMAESSQQKMQEMLQQNEQAEQKLNQEFSQADQAQQLQDLLDKIEQDPDLLEDIKEELRDKIESKSDRLKDEMAQKLEKMVDDGFLDEEKLAVLKEKLEDTDLGEMLDFQREIEQENKVYELYDQLREEVEPEVEEWFEVFAQKLPRTEDFSLDEDNLTTGGELDLDALSDVANHVFQTVYNPRVIKESVEPRFMASIVLDVSGSMTENMREAQKLLVFYSELFTRITEAFGYIRFSIHVFSNSVTEIKGFDHDYNLPIKNKYSDGSESTVKVRLMNKAVAGGGTNMLPAVQKVAAGLNQEKDQYPEYLSAFYLIGDGGDTCNNEDNIRTLVESDSESGGLGEHIKSATLIGNESQRKALSDIFGDENTEVASTMEEVIEMNMERVLEDIEAYVEDLTQ